MSELELRDIPGITLAGDAPVFNEPWEAQAFAMVVHLHAQGRFSWGEWADALSRQIASDPDQAYYANWLAALEVIVSETGMATPEALATRKAAWQEAAERTPHGAPIELTDRRVFLTGRIDVPIERLETVRAALPLHIKLTREEAGCLSFEVTESASEPGRFDVAEVFVDRAAFNAHQTRTRSSAWFGVTEGIPRTYEVREGAVSI